MCTLWPRNLVSILPAYSPSSQDKDAMASMGQALRLHEVLQGKWDVWGLEGFYGGVISGLEYREFYKDTDPKDGESIRKNMEHEMETGRGFCMEIMQYNLHPEP